MIDSRLDKGRLPGCGAAEEDTANKPAADCNSARRRIMPSILLRCVGRKKADEGVGRGPGGPPHQIHKVHCWSSPGFLTIAHAENGLYSKRGRVFMRKFMAVTILLSGSGLVAQAQSGVELIQPDAGFVLGLEW